MQQVIQITAFDMSRSCWRGAEALHEKRVVQWRLRKADERARLKRAREVEEWRITGEMKRVLRNRQFVAAANPNFARCKYHSGRNACMTHASTRSQLHIPINPSEGTGWSCSLLPTTRPPKN